MKRILYSCLSVVFLFLFGTVKGQGSMQILPNPLCATPLPASGFYTTEASMQAQIPGATDYSWTVIGGPAGCTPTITPILGGGPATNSVAIIAVPCAGEYTICATGLNGGFPFAQNCSASPFSSGGYDHFVIFSPTMAAITSTPASGAICAGETITLNAQTTPTSSGTTYVWNTAAIISSISVSPLANTCYSVIGTIPIPTLPGGCTVTASSCVSVQTQSLSISPAAQTICVGTCATLTASGSTNITGVVWNSTATTFTDTACLAGIYTATGTFTGVAGSCTLNVTSSIATSTGVSMSISASNTLTCPQGVFTLTASPSNAVSDYTWTISGPGGSTVTSVSNTQTFQINSPKTITVTADFPGGCPGTTLISIGIAALAPTLTPSSPSICPNTAVTFTALGGVTYSFQYFPFNAPNTVTVAFGPNTNTASNVPTTLLPYRRYRVIADSLGCKGTSPTYTVYAYALTPTMAASSISNCPNSTFTLSGLPSQYSYTFGASVPSPPTNTTQSIPLTSSATSSTSIFPATYTLVADSLGCKGTAAITIYSLNFTPTLTASSLSVCPNTNFTLTAHGGDSYTFTPPTTVPPTTVLPSASGSKSVISNSSFFPATYTLTVDSAGCVGKTTTLTISSLTINPRFGITLNTSSVCPTSPITFTARSSSNSTPVGALTFTYFNGSTVIPSSPNTATSTIYNIPANFTAGTFSIIADSAGCKGTANLTLYKRTLQPILSLSSPSVCANTNVTVTANGTGAGTNYTFVAQPINSAVTTTVLQTNPAQPTTNWISHTPSVATTYTVRVDSAGCNNLPIIGTSTIQVDMYPALTPTIASTTPTVCAGLNTTLSIQNQPTYTLSWFSSTSSNTISLDSMVVVNPSVATCYTVKATDPLGCIGSGTICIGINPAPLLGLTMAISPSTICPGQTATMTVAGGITYTWSPVSVVAPVNGSVVVGSPSVTTVYSVTGNNGYGCIGTQTLEAFVGIYPNLSIAASANAVCAGFHSTLTAFGANTYTWTGTTLTSPIYQQSISVPPGTYTLTGSNGGTCNRDTTKVIVLAPNFSLNISQSSPTTCITNNYPVKYSKPVTLIASGGGDVYTWFPCASNMAYCTYSIGPITDVQPPVTTCYTVTSVTSVCSGSAATCVTVIPQFTMNVTPPLPIICYGDCIDLSIINISTLAVGAASTYTYIWKEPISIPPIPVTIDEPMNPTVVACPKVTSTYTVEVRDIRSCVSIPRLVTVTVLPQPLTSILIPTINSVPINTVCYVGNMPGATDNIITLTGVNQNSDLPLGVAPTYTWMSPYDPPYNPFKSSKFNNAVIIGAPLRLPQVVVYTLQSGYNGVPGCKRLDTVSVRVIDCRPVSDNNVRFTSDMQEICTRQCVSFINLVDTAAGVPQQYYWVFSGGSPSVSTLANPVVCYNLPGVRNVELTVTNRYLGPSTGEGDTVSAGHTWRASYIKVVDIPNVTIVPPGELRSDTVIRFGESVRLKGSGATSYTWSPDYNISSITGLSVVVNPYQTTQYILMGYNNKNCFSSDTINVIVIEECGEMFIPNAFSPNGDGHNDKLYVRGVCLQSLTFMIFDRWGEKVFETNTQSEGWDGKYKGEDMNSGVFVFRLEGKTYDGKAYSLKGNITLIR